MTTVEVFDCARRAYTVAAIKYVRTLRGLDLMSAKGLIDEVYCRCRSIRLEFISEAEGQAFHDQMTAYGFSCRFVVESP